MKLMKTNENNKNNIYENWKQRKILSENKRKKHYLHGNRNLNKRKFLMQNHGNNKWHIFNR